MNIQKNEFSELIKTNIKKYGFHITIVGSHTCPRFAYTIGLFDIFSFELILAGGIIYKRNDLSEIFSSIVQHHEKSKSIEKTDILVANLGTFSFTTVHPSWSKLMMLGAFEYYNGSDIPVFQVNPDKDHFTLDIPNMVKQWKENEEPIWQWLKKKWNLSVPENSTAITDIQALKGKDIKEVTRWEDNHWEMFSDPESGEEESRVATLATMIGIDKSLVEATKLKIGKGIWRTSRDSGWNNWG